jgi:hypothetical protein
MPGAAFVAAHTVGSVNLYAPEAHNVAAGQQPVPAVVRYSDQSKQALVLGWVPPF